MAHIQALYDDGISFLDEQIGRLLAELRRLKLEDRTLVVFTSDHGEGFLEHGYVTHGNTPYDELLKVPLILRFPGSPRMRILPSVGRLLGQLEALSEEPSKVRPPSLIVVLCH